jgi:hypothetical protein
MVFLSNSCLKMYKNLPREQKVKVVTRMRQKRVRTTENMKKGAKVTYRGKTCAWPKEPDKEDAFMETFLPAHLYDIAACPTASPEERGSAMDRVLAMQASGTLTL